MISHGEGFSPVWLLAAILAYVALLLAAGAWAERRAARGYQAAGQGLIYALSLTVYCTSWTYFGSVGSAANSGMLYATIYLGPTLVMLGSWQVVRRMIHLRQRYRFSSVVDLITQRYGHSVAMGAFITLILLLGMLPYIGLQLRALVETFTVVTGLEHDHDHGGFWHFSDELIVVVVALLTATFGLRRVDTRERQHGLMAVLAVESLVKLVAFVAVGAFVTWGLFDGFFDLLTRLDANPTLRQRFVDAPLTGSTYVTWMTYLVLSMAAIIFLPRMFHVMVVGNHDERHLLTAMWVFPLYLLLMSLFVLPIAIGGLLLGYPLSSADWLVIRLPFDRGGPALTLLAYLGGFSAALGMIMVACTTMAIMFSNHVVLPLIDRGLIGERLRGGLRPIRWGIVFLMLIAAYRFQEGLANSYLLIQMGLISFAAVLQFVPAAIGGLYWTRANKLGAWWGLALGWATWAYTLLLPAVIRSGLGDAQWLTSGPWAMEFLRPEALFGLDIGSPYANTAFWTLLLNVSGYIVGSLLGQQDDDQSAMAHVYAKPFGNPRRRKSDDSGKLRIAYATVGEQIERMFARYLPAHEAAQAIEQVQRGALAEGESSLSGPAYLELTARAERTLAGAIGAAMARKAASETLRLDDRESAALQVALASQVAELHISPQQLREQVDYFRSLQTMGEAHAQAMEEKIAALEEAVQARDLADASRRESEQRFRSLADSAPVMIWMSSSDGESYYNRAWLVFTGRSSDEQARQGWLQGIHPEEQADALALNERMKALQCGAEQVFRFRRADGEYRHLRVHILPRHGADGALLGIVGSADDISDLLAAEQTLRRDNDELEALIGERTRELQQSCADLQEREQTIRTITDSAQDAVVMVDDGGLVSYWNPAAERILGWSKNEALGQRLSEFLLPERFRAAHLQAYASFQQGKPGRILGKTVEMVALNRGGGEIPVDLSLSSTLLKGKLHAIGLLRDISERKLAADALLREKAWSDDVIRLAPSFIIGLGRSGEVILFNDYAERLTGYTRDEVIGKRWSDVFSTPEGRSEDSATIAHALQTGEAINHQPENAILIRSGSPRLVSWSSQIMLEDGEVKMLLSFGVDVTERRRAEDDLKKNYDELKRLNERLEEAQNQLLQSEKMASIGQLAAGVAHEINNPVGFVSSNLQTLKSYSEQMLELIETYQTAATGISDSALLASIVRQREALDIDFLQDDLPALIKESEEGLRRVKKIVEDLKDFSHVSEGDWQYADLNAGLESTLNVVWNEVKYKARVDKHYATLPPVECLAGQLNQVFMNLIINAVHALDDGRGMGTITLSTGHQGNWVWVEVKDNGRGMSEAVQRRIFEPFFTTKPVGKGTGLGMSMSYNIVNKHAGRIELDSTPGQGSRITVWVPVEHPRMEVVQ